MELDNQEQLITTNLDVSFEKAHDDRARTTLITTGFAQRSPVISGTAGKHFAEQDQVSPLLFSNPFNRLAASADSIVGGPNAVPTVSCPATDQVDEFMANGVKDMDDEVGIVEHDDATTPAMDRLTVIGAPELQHEFENQANDGSFFKDSAGYHSTILF